MRSADITPTSPTWAKSKPLDTIWVPTKMSYSKLAKASSSVAWAFFFLVVSKSIRATRAVGKSSANSSSMRSVPKPWALSAVLPHAMHVVGAGRSWYPQW